jgi:hypothetical protein
MRETDFFWFFNVTVQPLRFSRQYIRTKRLDIARGSYFRVKTFLFDRTGALMYADIQSTDCSMRCARFAAFPLAHALSTLKLRSGLVSLL